MTDEVLKIISIFAFAIISVLVVEYVILHYVPGLIPGITSALSGSALSSCPDSSLVIRRSIMP